jgi:hypothetical protein
MTADGRRLVSAFHMAGEVFGLTCMNRMPKAWMGPGYASSGKHVSTSPQVAS